MIERIKRMFLATDRKFRQPRKWSNRELKRFSHLFTGRVINVSGWKDIDEEGKHYKDYFSNASDYWLSNYSDSKGTQNIENELFLDLEKNVPPEQQKKFDVVFNHTVLEHIYDCRKAFENLCMLSKDVIIVVVPYIQQVHGNVIGAHRAGDQP